MKNINRIHSGVADLVQERLTRLMGADVDVRMEGGEELAFGLLAEGIPEHTYTVLLDLAPLQDRGLLMLDSQLCLAFVDRILGGRSKTPPAPRALTSIDQAAAEGVIELILRCFREGWKDFCPVKMAAMDRRPEFDQVQFVTTGEPVLTAALSLKGDLGEGRIRLCVPVGSLRAMVGGDSLRMAVRPGPEKAAAIRNALNQTLEQASSSDHDHDRERRRAGAQPDEAQRRRYRPPRPAGRRARAPLHRGKAGVPGADGTSRPHEGRADRGTRGEVEQGRLTDHFQGGTGDGTGNRRATSEHE